MIFPTTSNTSESAFVNEFVPRAVIVWIVRRNSVNPLRVSDGHFGSYIMRLDPLKAITAIVFLLLGGPHVEIISAIVESPRFSMSIFVADTLSSGLARIEPEISAIAIKCVSIIFLFPKEKRLSL